MLKDIKKTSFKNMGGIPSKVYFADKEDIAVFPTLPSNPADLDEIAVLTGDFQMKPGKKFHELYVTVDTSGLANEDQGEVDGMSFKPVLNIFHPGLGKEIQGFVSYTNNRDMVFVAPDAEGVLRVVGSDLYPARKQAGDGANTGQAAADRKGVNLQFFSYGNTPAPIYEGTIPLTPAV
jgi:hypothetical protein